MATFPPYLLLHMRRFGVNPDWTPKKLEVDVLVDDEVDLSPMRAHGLQPGTAVWALGLNGRRSRRATGSSWHCRSMSLTTGPGTTPSGECESALRRDPATRCGRGRSGSAECDRPRGAARARI